MVLRRDVHDVCQSLGRGCEAGGGVRRLGEQSRGGRGNRRSPRRGRAGGVGVVRGARRGRRGRRRGED
ncbi:MAG: hypothetical protein COS95_08510 [Ignavibacteriales bacterium CG07_land_8_20_14_0_80_59_12]|nr:MAG: hypothetical protein COS95_08510 [Ignavibacteriales bacterium CG07_land_8_20_14_0_80_59_12]